MKRYLIMLSMLILSVLTSFAQQQSSAFSWATGTPTFQPLASTLSLNGVAFKDNQYGVIVGSDGKVYRTTNGGSSWIAIINPVASLPGGFFGRPEFDDVAFIGQNSYIAVASLGKVIKSPDGGNTWDTVYLADLRYNYKSVASHNGIVLIGGEAGKLFRSTNYGETWDQINDSDFGMFTLNDISIVDNDTMYIAASVGRIFKSTDGGLTWNVQRPEESSSSGFNAIAFKNSTHGIAVGESGKVYRTNNGGTTWTRVQNVFASTALDGVIYKNNTIIVVGQVGQAWSSKDNGATWVLNRKQGYTGRFKDIAFINNTTAFAVGMQGRAYKIDNITYEEGGNNNEEPAPAPPTLTWTASNTGMLPAADGASSEPALMSIYFLNEQVGYVGGGSGRLYKTIDAGASWNYVQYPGFRTNSGVHSINDIIFTDENTGYAAFSSDTVMKTIDGGASWEKLSVANENNTTNGITHFTIATIGNKVILAGLYGKLFISENGGPFTYNTIQQNGELDIRGYCKFGTNAYFCGENGKVLKSTDGNGDTWENSREGITDPYDDMLDIHFISENEGYVVGEYGAHYKTTEGGAMWATFPLSEVGTNILSGVDFRGNNGVIVGANGKAWVTTDGGASWTYSKPEPNATTFLYDVKFISNNVAIVVGDRQKIYKLVIGNVAEEPNLTATPADVIFQSEATATEPLTKTVEVTANVNWVVDESIEWLTVAPRSGDANAQLTFTAEPNPTTNQRSGTVRVRTADNNIVREINVTQAAGSGTAPVVTLEVTPASFNFGASAGLLPFQNGSVTVTSNSAWTVTKNIEWVVIPSANGNGNGNFVFTVDNNTGAQRSGVITVTAGNVTREVTITQAAGSVAPPPTPPALDPIGTWVNVPMNVTTLPLYSVFPVNESTLYTVSAYDGDDSEGSTYIIKSENAGNTWTPTAQFGEDEHIDLKDICFRNATSAYIVGTDGAILKKSNNGWLSIFIRGLGFTELNAVKFPTENTGYIVGDKDGTQSRVYKTIDGETWARLTSAPLFNYIDLYFVTDELGFMVGERIVKTIDGGTTWTTYNLLPTETNNDLTGVHFTSAQVGYVVGNGGKAYKTSNGGTTWEAMTLPELDNADLKSVYFVNATEGYIVGHGGRIYQTRNGGTSWARQTSGINTILYKVRFLNENVGYAVGASGRVLKFVRNTPTPTLAVDRNEVNFQAANATNPLDQQTTTITVTSNRAWTVTENIEWLSVNTENGTNNGTFVISVLPNTGDQRTGTVTVTAGTLTQTITVNQAAGTPATNLTVNPASINFAVSPAPGSGEIVNVTSNTNWTVTASLDWISVFPTAGNNSGMFMVSATANTGAERTGNITVSGGGVTRTITVTQAGTTPPSPTNPSIVWELKNNGTSDISTLYGVSFPTSRVGYAVGTSGRVYKTINRGDQWSEVVRPTTTSISGVYFYDAEIGVVVSDNRILRTTNGGTSWTTFTPQGTGLVFNGINGHGQTIIAVGGNGLIMRTTDGGETWNRVNSQAVTVNTLSRVTFASADTVFIAGARGRVFKSVDGGLNWSSANTGITSLGILRDIYFKDGSNGIVVGQSGTKFKTSNGGTSWQQISTTAGGDLLAAAGKGDVYIFTNNGGGSFVSFDNRETWGRYNFQSGFTQRINDLDFADANTVFAVGSSGKVYRGTISGITPQAPTPTLTVNPTAVNFNATTTPAAPLTQTITVTANNPWTVSIPTTANWLTATPANGSAPLPGFALTAQPNTGAERAATVTVNSGNLSRTITVTQAGTPAPPAVLVVTPPAVSFDASAVIGTQTRSVAVTSNNDWTVSIPAGDASWLSAEPAQGTANNTLLTLRAINNDGSEARTSTITVTAGGVSRTIAVTQTADLATPASVTWTRHTNVPAPAGTTGRATLFAVATPASDKALVGGQYGNLYKTDNTGTDWSKLEASANPYTGTIQAMAFADSQKGYAVGSNGKVMKTTNGGAGWSMVTPDPAVKALWAVATKGSIVLASGYNAGTTNDGFNMRRSENSGAEWSNFTVPAIGTMGITDIQFVTDSLVFASGEEKVFKSYDAGKTWTNISNGIDLSNQDSRIRKLQDIYFIDALNGYVVGNLNTAYKTTDGGARWRQVNQFDVPGQSRIDLQSIAFFGKTGIITGSESAAWTTTDGGETWAFQKPDNTSDWDVNDVAFYDYKTAVAAGHDTRIYKATFSRVSAPPTLTVSSENVRLFGTQLTQTITVESNADWTVADDADWMRVIKNPINNNELVISLIPNLNITEDKIGTVVVTANNGRNIAVKNITVTMPVPTALTVNPKTVNFAAASATALPQSETITVASNKSWIVSVPQTATWLTVNPAAGTAPATFAITAQNNTGEQRTADITVTAGTGNNTKTETIRVTQAAGVVTPSVTWTRITEGIERQGTGTLAALQTVSAPTDQVAYAAGTRGKLFKTTTGGTSWTEFRNNPIAAMAPTAEIRSLYFTDAQTGYVVGYNGNVMRTVDGGANWIVVNPAPSPRMLWAVGAYGNSIIASGYNGDTDNVGNIRRSTDGGVTWETITSEIIDTNGVTGIHFVNANLVMASGQSGKVYKSVDGGATWVLSNTGITSTRTLNHIYFKDPKNGYVVGDRSYAYKTTDGGDTWNPVDQFQVNNGNRNLLGVAMHGRAGVIVGASGTAWTTTDGGATWVYQKPEEEFTLSINKVDFFDYQTAIAAGHDLRVFRANFSGLTPPPALTLSQEKMELPATAAPQTVTVTTPSTWITYADVDWLTVVPDGQTLTVTALPNTGAARRGVVTVLAGTDGNTTVKYITVNQDSPAVAPELAVTPEIVQFEDAAGAQTITVTSNANWTVTETAPWIDITTPNGTDNGTFTINATANTNATARNAVVTVTAGTITNPTVKTITVNQAGATIVNPSVPGQWVAMENDVIDGDLRTVFAINANKVQTAGVNFESMFVSADANLIYRSADKGVIFEDAQPIEDWTETINDLFFVTEDTGFAVTEDGRVLKTRDGGIIWQNRVVSQSALKAVRFVSESLGYAVGNNGKLYKTNDASDWTEVPTNTTINFKSAYFVNANCGYLVGNGIVRYNSDDNITVQRYDNTMLHGVYFFNDNKGFAVGENSTVLKTINGGLRWDLVTIEGLPTDVTLRSIYFADADNGHIVGDGGRIYKTSNGGRTWVLEASTTTEDLYSVHFFDTETGYAVGDGPKFLRYIAPVPPAPPAPPTAQEGWTVVNAGPEQAFTEYKAIKFRDSMNGIAVGVGNRIAKTTDGGLTWTNPQIPEMTGYGLFNLRYVGNTIQLADNQGRIFRSDDNGQNWNTIGTAEPYWFNNVCFINEQTIIGGSIGRVDRVTPIRRTINGGTYWTDPIANPGLGQCNDFDFVTERIGWAVGNSATVMKTTDGGLTWTSQNPNIPTNTVFLDDYSNNGQLGGIIDVDFVDEQTGYICGFDGKILKSINGGASWVEQNSGTQVALRGIFAINADLVYAVGDGGTILKTNNGGSTWTRELSNTTKNLHEVYFLDENNGYAVGDDRTIVKYHHTPIEWVALSSGVENANASLNDVHFLNDRVGYIVGSNGVGLRKTNDAGVNWTKITTNFDNNNTNKVFFVDEVNGFVAPSNDLLKHTTSSGENWDSYAGSPSGATDIYAVNENIAYATHTNGRIYRLKRTPNENTWYGTVGGPDDPTLGSSGGSKALHLVNSNIGYALVFNGSNDFILKGTRLSETSGSVQDVWSDPSSGTMFFPRGSMNDIYFVNQNLGFVVGNNGAVKMTTNGGLQWSNVSVATVANLNKLYFRTATEGYIVGDNGTILRTEDGGSTWRIDPTGVTANLKSVHSANGMNVIYVVGENNTLLRRGTPAPLPELAVNPEAHTFAALATANEPLTKTIEVTCNVDWTVTKNVEWLSVQPASESNNGTFTITAQEHFVRNPRTGVVTVSAGGITKKITITQEAGEPQLVNGWNVITTDPNAQGGYGGWGAQFTHIAFKDNMHGFASGPNKKLAKTTDGGITWTISDFPVANVAFYGLSYTNNSLRLAQNSNIIRKSLTNGNTWEQPIGTAPTDWSYFDQVHFVNDDLVIGSTWGGTPGTGPQRVKRSINGGVSWDTVHTNGFAEVLKFDFINDQIGWGVGYKGTVVKTTDAGRTWTEQATPLPRNTTNDHISCLMGVDFVDENIGYAAGYDGKILKTTNGGEEWLPLNSSTTKHLYDIKAFNADLVLAVGETGTILRSNDAGISWTAEASNTTEDLQEVHFLDDKNAVAVGNKRTILRYKVRELATLNINPSTVRLQSPANSTNTITLEANRNWTATASDWIQLSSVAGIAGSFTIEVKARTVNGLVSQRVGIITFEAGEGVSKVVKSVRVIQEGGVSTISINKDSETVQSSGGIIDIEVTSNDNWIVEDNVDWAYATPESGAQNGSVNITVVPNTDPKIRTATFTFKTINDVSKTMTITQGAAGTKLVVDKNVILAPSTTSTHPVRITSNLEWTATPSVNWITVVPRNGTGNGVINIIVNENPNTEVREGKVTVAGGGVIKEIAVHQNGKAVAVNWVVVPNTVDNDFTSVMMPSQNTAYITGWSIYGGTSGEPAKVVKTTDYGDTWNNFTPDMSMTGGFGYNSIYFTDDDNGHIAGFSSKYGKTQNAGAGWNVKAVAGPTYQQWGNVYYSLDFPTTNNVGYMVGADWTIYKTIDAGETWTRKYDSQGRGVLRCVDFVNDQIGYAVGDKKTILKTVDGGDTWTTLSNDQDGSVLHGVHFINERVGYVVGYEGTYGKTVDGGVNWTWTDGLNGYNNLYLYSVKFVTPDKGYIVGGDGKIFKTENGGQIWEEEPSVTTNTLMSVSFFDEEHGFAVGKKGTILKYVPVGANLSVSPTNVSAPASGKRQSITVTSNGAWTVESKETWIKTSVANGNNNGNVNLTIDPNPTIETRVGTVKFKLGNLEAAVVVSQSGLQPDISITPGALVTLGAIERRTQEIKVKSNVKWDLVRDTTDETKWFTVTPMKGNSGETIVTITATQNNDSKARSTSFKIVAGTTEKIVNVNQNGVETSDIVLKVNPKEVIFEHTKGMQAVQVTSNQEWIVERTAEWITLDKDTGVNNGIVLVSVDVNESIFDRVGMLIFKTKNNQKFESVLVTQKGKHTGVYFEVNPEYITLEAANNSSGNITITTNQAWTASDNADWLSISKEEGNGDAKINVVARENTATEERTATVTLQSGATTKTVVVTQLAAEMVLTVNPETLEFTHEKGSKEVSIESNTKWTLSTESQWITFTQNEGDGNGNFNVEVEENTANEERTGTVKVAYANGKEKVINVKQAAAPASVEVASDDMFIYPNPTEDVLFIKHTNTIKSVKVIDARGKAVISIDKLSVNSVYMKDLTAGTYTVVIVDVQGNKISKKITKL